MIPGKGDSAQIKSAGMRLWPKPVAPVSHHGSAPNREAGMKACERCRATIRQSGVAGAIVRMKSNLDRRSGF